ncbi:MAG: saccharopine dehydrogenase NADP-binding domain-containing protein [Arenicella sp.]|nr:saccharopine dehydrogenase NADP-binding domain-containing protein [Arenicella sp.]
MADREFDVVVWGATGFTGKWVARHLFDNYPQTKLRWAIAGRNQQKLDDVHDFIGDKGRTVQTMVADSGDESSLREMASRTRVIITTVGPYAYYGSLLVKVCAELGTHYVDLTGEVPWMRRMIDAHTPAAEASGARIVHCCGFDSIPSDMGNYFIQQQAMQKFGQYLKSVRYLLLKMKGGASGGTIHSMFNVMKEAVEDKEVRRLMVNPYSLNPDRSFKGPDKRDQTTAIYDKELGTWTAPFVMSAINTRVVRRGNALLHYPYGKQFSYSETMATKGRLAAMGIASGFMLFAGVATTAPGRKLLSWVLPSQGEGPQVDPENPGFYLIEFHGSTADGEKLVARVKGDSDPGYGSTSKMLAESAVCLALDEQQLEVGGGFWTPASAMGEALLSRLQQRAGLSFEIVED